MQPHKISQITTALSLPPFGPCLKEVGEKQQVLECCPVLDWALLSTAGLFGEALEDEEGRGNNNRRTRELSRSFCALSLSHSFYLFLHLTLTHSLTFHSIHPLPTVPFPLQQHSCFQMNLLTRRLCQASVNALWECLEFRD